MPAARSHCSHHSNREIVAGGHGGAKAVNDTHIMVRRGIVLMWTATALVFGLNIVAAVMQDRFLIGVRLAVKAPYSLAGLALGRSEEQPPEFQPTMHTSYALICCHKQ